MSQLNQPSVRDKRVYSNFLQAKGSWRRQMNAIKSFTKIFSSDVDQTANFDRQDLLEVFDEILILYGGSDREVEGIMACLRHRLYPTKSSSSQATSTQSAHESILFFMPCLLNYFMYGSFEHENRIRDLILDFAHTELSTCMVIYCYVHARIPPGGIDQDSIISFLQSIEARGNKACETLLSPAAHPISISPTVYEEDEECKSLLSLPSPHLTYPLHLTHLPPRGPIFASLLDFWGEVANLSIYISTLSLPDRPVSLCENLTHLVQTYLPSPFLFIPTDPHSHRLYHIHVDECRAFRTGGRAPLLLVCEVVYMSHPL
ncbi:hypothetical protein EON65_02455, partial [archaeon]